MGVFNNMQIIIEADKLICDNFPVHRNHGYDKEYADNQLAGFVLENIDSSHKFYRRRALPYILFMPETVITGRSLFRFLS